MRLPPHQGGEVSGSVRDCAPLSPVTWERLNFHKLPRWHLPAFDELRMSFLGRIYLRPTSPTSSNLLTHTLTRDCFDFKSFNHRSAEQTPMEDWNCRWRSPLEFPMAVRAPM